MQCCFSFRKLSDVEFFRECFLDQLVLWSQGPWVPLSCSRGIHPAELQPDRPSWVGASLQTVPGDHPGHRVRGWEGGERGGGDGDRAGIRVALRTHPRQVGRIPTLWQGRLSHSCSKGPWNIFNFVMFNSLDVRHKKSLTLMLENLLTLQIHYDHSRHVPDDWEVPSRGLWLLSPSLLWETERLAHRPEWPAREGCGEAVLSKVSGRLQPQVVKTPSDWRGFLRVWLPAHVLHDEPGVQTEEAEETFCCATFWLHHSPLRLPDTAGSCQPPQQGGTMNIQTGLITF